MKETDFVVHENKMCDAVSLITVGENANRDIVHRLFEHCRSAKIKQEKAK